MFSEPSLCKWAQFGISRLKLDDDWAYLLLFRSFRFGTSVGFASWEDAFLFGEDVFSNLGERLGLLLLHDGSGDFGLDRGVRLGLLLRDWGEWRWWWWCREGPKVRWWSGAARNVVKQQ